MRFLTASILSLALSTSAMAADTGALAAGRPAGVKQADLVGDPLFIVLGVVAIGVIIGVAASSGSSSAAAAAAAGTTTTTTTTTTS